MIEGLDRLAKLEDLTLYNNRITRLENMDSLTKLHIFSVGNNQLKELDNVCTALLFGIIKHCPILIIYSLLSNPKIKVSKMFAGDIFTKVQISANT